MEVETGFEPVYKDLQSFASPLGHSTGGLRADDRTRTGDIHLGKVMRYQLRYIRMCPAYVGHGAGDYMTASQIPNSGRGNP